jgi:Glycosyl transferase family 2/N-terminal domain of galactosyltransferase
VAEVISHGTHAWVQDNRWDLVERERDPDVDVAIIVPYFEQTASLERMYAVIAADARPTERWELIVVDDGSAVPPPAPPVGLPIRTRRLSQPDRGCRPGRARNLGVAASSAEVLIFLDADTLPAFGTIRRLAAWPARIPDALVVGRRHHADLSGWTPAATVEWLAGRGPPPPIGSDPAWLDEGYRATGDLRRIDRRSYRFVISAVMACHRCLYEDIGGFDPARTEYGGDDWEMASRAYTNGAVLAHDPAAVAWHDEPDWSERDGRLTIKNAETLWLAESIPDPLARGTAIRHAHTDVLVDLEFEVGVTAGRVVATIDSILTQLPDTTVRIPPHAPSRALHHTAADPRVLVGEFSRRQRERASLHITQHVPGVWQPGRLVALAEQWRDCSGGVLVVGDARRPVATVTPARAAGRRRRARKLAMPTEQIRQLVRVVQVSADDAGLRPLTAEVDLAAHFGRW